MIDRTKLKAPGWQRVVQELLSPAPDDGAYLARLLSVLGQVSGAKQGVLLAVPAIESGEPVLSLSQTRTGSSART